MKIAVISEIHGNLSTLQAVLAEIGAAGLDRIIKVASAAGGHLVTIVNPSSVGLLAYDDDSSLQGPHRNRYPECQVRHCRANRIRLAH